MDKINGLKNLQLIDIYSIDCWSETVRAWRLNRRHLGCRKIEEMFGGYRVTVLLTKYDKGTEEYPGYPFYFSVKAEVSEKQHI
jgi:hypothetical protein